MSKSLEKWIAIPKSEYEDLLKQKQVNIHLEAQLNHHMKFRPYQQQQSETNQTEDKVGEGAPSNIDFFESFTSQLRALQQSFDAFRACRNPPADAADAADVQQGGGADDLTTAFPDPVSALPSEQNSDLDKISHPLPTDLKRESEPVALETIDDKLIDLVTPHLREKAKKLLTRLNDHKDVINFTPTGNILIDGVIIDGANIFNLFPLLFKPAHYQSHPHLQTLVNEIATLGYGNLISRYYSAGISPKGRNLINNRAQIHQELKKAGPFWYKIHDDE